MTYWAWSIYFAIANAAVSVILALDSTDAGLETGLERAGFTLNRQYFTPFLRPCNRIWRKRSASWSEADSKSPPTS